MSANLNYWTAPIIPTMDFLTPTDVGMSEGRWADSPGPNWGTGPYHMWNPFVGCAGMERAPPQVYTKFHIHVPHTHTHALPLANSLKRVTFVLQLPVKRGEHCLRVNKVKFTEQVNIRKHRFHFQSTFYVHPTCSSLPEVTVLELDDWCCDHRWESRNRVVCNLITAHYNTVCSKQSRLTVYSIEVWC